MVPATVDRYSQPGLHQQQRQHFDQPLRSRRLLAAQPAHAASLLRPAHHAQRLLPGRTRSAYQRNDDSSLTVRGLEPHCGQRPSQRLQERLSSIDAVRPEPPVPSERRPKRHAASQPKPGNDPAQQQRAARWCELAATSDCPRGCQRTPAPALLDESHPERFTKPSGDQAIHRTADRSQLPAPRTGDTQPGQGITQLLDVEPAFGKPRSLVRLGQHAAEEFNRAPPARPRRGQAPPPLKTPGAGLVS